MVAIAYITIRVTAYWYACYNLPVVNITPVARLNAKNDF